MASYKFPIAFTVSPALNAYYKNLTPELIYLNNLNSGTKLPINATLYSVNVDYNG